MNWQTKLQKLGFKNICGIDEAGRGPLAGPVVAGAVIIPQGIEIKGADDSKKLTEAQRNKLAEEIKAKTIWAIAQCTPKEIDKLNILNASKLAMRRAVQKLSIQPDFILGDAVTLNLHEIPQISLPKGDAREECIACASILAKTHRDDLMKKLAQKYPEYGFDEHFGYPTERHYFALEVHGECKIHRQSFRLKR